MVKNALVVTLSLGIGILNLPAAEEDPYLWLEEVEGDPDEDASAINSLMSLLGHGSELQEEDSDTDT